MVVLIIWGLILGSGFIAFAAMVHTLVGGRLRDILTERSRSVMLFFSSVSLMCISVSFLGLSDIRKDYAGYKLQVNGTPIQSLLPDWARCELEWSIVYPAVFTIAISQLVLVLILMKQNNVVSKTLGGPADPTWGPRIT